MAKWQLLETVEGFYLSHIVYHLHYKKVLECLNGEETVAEIAARFDYDAATLNALLDFVYQTTDILQRDRSNRYRIHPQYLPYHRLGFHLDKFIGAYGPALTHLEESLRSSTLGNALLDEKMLADAFTKVGLLGVSLSTHLIRERGITSLVDLGCGSAALLMELCRDDTTFKGWGVDRNASMCAAATEKINTAGLTSRIRIIHADVRELEAHFPPEMRHEIGALHGSSILNEFFRSGSTEAISFVNNLKRLFPNRLLFVVDYYGKLTHFRVTPLRYRHTLIHDVAQVISAQGVPPPDIYSWATIYDAAGCALTQAYEGENDGIAWFAHIVHLGM